jgi:hypothetical protein
LVITQASDEVRAELDRFGITDAMGTDAYFDSVGEAIAAHRTASASSAAPGAPAADAAATTAPDPAAG